MIHLTPISDRTEEEISIPGPSLAPAFVGMSKACMRRALGCCVSRSMPMRVSRRIGGGNF